MAFDLTTISSGGLPLVSRNNLLDTLLKKKQTEIFLFKTSIAGTSHLPDPSILDDMTPGTELRLQREDNPFDPFAVLVLNTEGRKLGYIPRRDNIIFSRLLDAGKILKGTIETNENCGSYSLIRFKIYLVDF